MPKSRPKHSNQALPVVETPAPEVPIVSRPNLPWYGKAFVFFHLAAITIWCLPDPPQAVLQGKVEAKGSDILLEGNSRFMKTQPVVSDYLLLTGMWQFWDMFAPNPSCVCFHYGAEVVYKDGSKQFYAYPGLDNLNVIEKYWSERYRKFMEQVREPNASMYWPPLGLGIAHKMDTDPKNPPVLVRLQRFSKEVMPPNKKPLTEYTKVTFFEYVVDQAALRGKA